LAGVNCEVQAALLTKRFIESNHYNKFPHFTLETLTELENSFERKGFNFGIVRDDVNSFRVRVKGAM